MQQKPIKEDQDEWDESIPCTMRKVLDPDRSIMVMPDIVRHKNLSLAAKGLYLMIEDGGDLSKLYDQYEPEMKELIDAGYMTFDPTS